MTPFGDRKDRRVLRDGYEGPERCHDGGDGEGSGLVFWMRAVAVVGIPGAIAIFLVYVGATEIPKIARQTQQNHDAMMRMQEMSQQHSEHSAAMFRMLQRICSNTARNDAERERCFDK